jgi:hypothetical protein
MLKAPVFSRSSAPIKKGSKEGRNLFAHSMIASNVVEAAF